MADGKKENIDKLKQKVESWDSVFGVLSNTTKKMIIFYIGYYAKVKGGAKDMIMPIVEMGRKFGTDIHPFSIAPKLSELRNKDKMVDLGADGYWRLNEKGRMAYKLIEFVWKNFFMDPDKKQNV